MEESVMKEDQKGCKRFITADWHLGEDRFKIMQRPFKTVDEMIDTLVNNHNSVVSPNDHVIVVGDAVSQNAPEFLEHVGRFNGKKTLFRGNHDRVFADHKLKKYFDRIVPDGVGMMLKLEDPDTPPCWVNHYPTESRVDLFNLVGHVHGAWKVQKNALNVGVDVHHFFPVDVEKIVPFMYNAICNFFDQDVWVSAAPSQKFHEQRGKPGRYLDVEGRVGGER